MEKLGRQPACYIQVNTGEEPQKAGILPKDLDAFVAQCRDQYKLPIVGLMCIPPVDEEPALHLRCWPRWRRATDLTSSAWA